MRCMWISCYAPRLRTLGRNAAGGSATGGWAVADRPAGIRPTRDSGKEREPGPFTAPDSGGGDGVIPGWRRPRGCAMVDGTRPLSLESAR